MSALVDTWVSQFILSIDGRVYDMKQWVPFAALCGLSGFCLGLSILGLAINLDQAKQPPNYAFAQVSDNVGQNIVKTYTQQVVIPFHSDVRALMIDAKIDNRMNMTFVVDTGATYTAISEDTALALGYRSEERRVGKECA